MMQIALLSRIRLNNEIDNDTKSEGSPHSDIAGVANAIFDTDIDSNEDDKHITKYVELEKKTLMSA